jgi:Domain of unknown function (DUF4260)
MKISGPKLLLHTEGLVALLGGCIYYRHSGESWGLFAALFLAPDLSMLGYVFGNSVGASTYDAFHTYTAPFLLWMILWLADKTSLTWICAIWIAHIGFDRLLGYGLKYISGFKDTHLGRV